MKLLTTTLVCLCVSSTAQAAKYNESFFCDIVAEELNGTSEVRTTYNKRIDILTDKVAWECDWTSKPYQAIGQALAYGRFEDKEPGIVFFQDVSKKVHKYNYDMMHDLSDFYDIHLRYYKVNKQTGAIEHIETYN